MWLEAHIDLCLCAPSRHQRQQNKIWTMNLKFWYLVLMGFIWDVGLATWSYKSFHTNLWAIQSSMWHSHCKMKVPHLVLLADKARVLCGSVRDCSSVKMLLMLLQWVKYMLSYAQSFICPQPIPQSLTNLTKRTLYMAKHGLPTIWFTLPWFYTAF